MRKFIALFSIILGVVSFSAVHADELDNEASVTNVDQRASDLPATVVVRVSAADQSISVMHSKDALPAKELASDAAFTPIATNGSMTGTAHSELDQDSSTDSWYFYFNYNSCSYPTYNYYGYNYYYTPYYNYNYGGYNYSYYNYNYGNYNYGNYGYGNYHGGYNHWHHW